MKFDKKYWSKAIKNPDWYLELNAFTKEAKTKLKSDSKEAKQFNKEVRDFFNEKLSKNQVALGSSGPDLDVERKQIDTIVIHHTSYNGRYRLDYLNTVQLLNIYAPYYANPTVRGEEMLKGMPLWSGHFRASKQVFWGYHWLMRMNGNFTRLLDDKQIGWHAGNWEINRRSIAICLDNDYENRDPTERVLKKLAAHIKQNYAHIDADNIIGHCEAKESTICPGGNFISSWKDQLVTYINDV